MMVVHSSLMDPAEQQMSRGGVLVCVVTWECGWGRESRAAARKPEGMTLRTARRHALMKARFIQAAGHRVGG